LEAELAILKTSIKHYSDKEDNLQKEKAQVVKQLQDKENIHQEDIAKLTKEKQISRC
jgi:hypothetical protein